MSTTEPPPRAAWSHRIVGQGGVAPRSPVGAIGRRSAGMPTHPVGRERDLPIGGEGAGPLDGLTDAERRVRMNALDEGGGWSGTG